MSQLFDPLYATVVQYVVSQSIWELYEIHFWQVLFGMWGKNRAFLTLQNRYEKRHYEGQAFAFLVVVFALSYLIQWLMHLRQQYINSTAAPPPEPQNGGAVDNNQNPTNETNVDHNNDQNQSAGNPQPNHENH